MTLNLTLSILFELLQNRRVTAPYLAEKYNISPRTVYRQVEKLSPFLPLFIRRGRRGGIFLADTYRLPVGYLNERERQALLQALAVAYAADPKESYLAAKRKLTTLQKEEKSLLLSSSAEEIFLLPPFEFSPSLWQTLQRSIREKKQTYLLLVGKERCVHPHALFLRENQWFLYAFFPKKGEFFSIPLAKIDGALLSENKFYPRKFSADELYSPLPDTR